MGARNLATAWKPGQSGNPTGRPKIPEHLRGILALMPDEVSRMIAKYARMDRAELGLMLETKAMPMLEACIAKIFQESYAKGDFTRLSFLLDRAIGKVPAVQPTDDEAAALQEIRDLSNEELIKLVKEKLPELEKPGVA